MKRICTTILFLLCLVVPLTLNADDNNRTKLTIRNESFTGIDKDEVYRDLSYRVTAELLFTEGIISVTMFGIGDGDVYLIDQHNQIVDQVSFFDSNSNVYLDIPAQGGQYCLVIWSESYYGEAYFVK
ncbi:MAG: hypothetical protein ACI3ZP_08880 [Candidatus Cryptobacteroides sp.]